MATTTADAIVARAIEVIEDLVPRSRATRFLQYRNEGDGDFEAWANMAAPAAFRRFQVRMTGSDGDPEASTSDLQMHWIELVVMVAYPKDARAGATVRSGPALERDKLMEQDRIDIEYAIGLRGAANFTPPFPDATLREYFPPEFRRSRGAACDFLVMRQIMSYSLARP